MSDRNLNHLHPQLRPICIQWLETCRQQSIGSFVTMTHRTIAEQDALYAQGRTKPGNIVTNAKGGQSPHNVTLPGGTPAACAFDFAIKRENGELNWDVRSIEFQTAVAIGKKLDLKWGGDFVGKLGDFVHFELGDWKKL